MVATFSLYSIKSPLNSSRGITFRLPVLTATRNSASSPRAVMAKERIFFRLLTISKISFWKNGRDSPDRKSPAVLCFVSGLFLAVEHRLK